MIITALCVFLLGYGAFVAKNYRRFMPEKTQPMLVWLSGFSVSTGIFVLLYEWQVRPLLMSSVGAAP